jgi:hypothetical protein
LTALSDTDRVRGILVDRDDDTRDRSGELHQGRTPRTHRIDLDAVRSQALAHDASQTVVRRAHGQRLLSMFERPPQPKGISKCLPQEHAPRKRYPCGAKGLDGLVNRFE